MHIFLHSLWNHTERYKIQLSQRLSLKHNSGLRTSKAETKLASRENAFLWLQDATKEEAEGSGCLRYSPRYSWSTNSQLSSSPSAPLMAIYMSPFQYSALMPCTFSSTHFGITQRGTNSAVPKAILEAQLRLAHVQSRNHVNSTLCAKKVGTIALSRMLLPSICVPSVGMQ